MHGAAPEGVSPPHTKAPCAPLIPFLGGRIGQKGSRRSNWEEGEETGESQSHQTWRWKTKRICNVSGCYRSLKKGEFFCAAHQAKPDVRDDGALKPIPLSRLMGRRA
ncbi:MAG: hypothetical protein HY243_15600 [Proteobacteria bacterium]|nr:hypothetical protein [Pseudomonadota bacterium]